MPMMPATPKVTISLRMWRKSRSALSVPRRAVTHPGNAAVFHEGERVLSGGWIA